MQEERELRRLVAAQGETDSPDYFGTDEGTSAGGGEASDAVAGGGSSSSVPKAAVQLIDAWSETFESAPVAHYEPMTDVKPHTQSWDAADTGVWEDEPTPVSSPFTWPGNPDYLVAPSPALPNHPALSVVPSARPPLPEPVQPSDVQSWRQPSPAPASTLFTNLQTVHDERGPPNGGGLRERRQRRQLKYR